MSDGNLIQVTYASLHEASSNCQSTANWLIGRIDQMESDLGPLRNTFQGADAEAYNQAQLQWNQAAQDLRQVLTNLSNALANAADDFQARDQKLAGQWGG